MDRTIALVTLGIALVMLCIAGWLTWSAFELRDGIAQLHTAAERRTRGDFAGALAAGRAAGEILGDDPLAVVAGFDPAAAGDTAAIEAACRAPGAAGESARVALGLRRALLGQDPGVMVGEGDAKLLEAIAKLAKGGAPSPLEPSRDAPPHDAVQIAWLRLNLAAAWKAGDAAIVRRSAGALALRFPKHPDAVRLRVTAALLDPALADAKALVASQLVTDKAERTALLRRIRPLAPARAEAIDRWTDDAPKPAPAATVADAGPALATEVEQAPAGSDLPLLMERCLAASRLDLARKLADKAPEARRGALRLVIDSASGDLEKVAQAAKPGSDAELRITAVQARDGFLCFHLSNGLGLVPATPFEVWIDGARADAKSVQRWGTLVAVERQGDRPRSCEIRRNKRVLAKAEVPK